MVQVVSELTLGDKEQHLPVWIRLSHGVSLERKDHEPRRTPGAVIREARVSEDSGAVYCG